MAAKLLLVATTLLSSMATTTVDFILESKMASGKLPAHLTPGSVKLVTNKVFDLDESTCNKAMASIRRQRGRV